MKFITDINDRERQRFIETLLTIRETCDTMIEALGEGEDVRLVAPAMVFTMSIMQIQDLFKALATAQQVDISDLDKPFGFNPPPLPDDPDDVGA